MLAMAHVSIHSPPADDWREQHRRPVTCSVLPPWPGFQEPVLVPVPIPSYVTTSAGTPINVAGGALLTQHRGIFVSGLPYKAKEKDIREYFSRAGKIAKFDVPRDCSTGKLKGIAAVEYTTPIHVQRAIDMYDGKPFMQRTLHVRPDRESNSVAMPDSLSEPLIVNGSSTKQVCTH